MATRFYYEASMTGVPDTHGVDPTITPAFDGAWNITTDGKRRWLTSMKAGTVIGQTETIGETSATSGINVLARQFIGPPLSAQTISGTVKGQVQAYEGVADMNAMAQTVIRVCSNDGATILATLLAADTTAPENASEFALSFANRKFPQSSISPATLTSYACAVGDRLVVEIGYKAHNTTTNVRNTIFRFGSDGASDLPEDETDTNLKNPWIEFSNTLTMENVVTRVTQTLIEAVVHDATSGIKATQVIVEAVIERDYVWLD